MSKRSCHLFRLLLLGGLLGPPQVALAQIIPDASLPTNSVVIPDGNTFQITGGTATKVNGGNLFHSFRQFSVPTGTTASFDNSATIANIITRVTGGSLSNIDGLIQANGNANLFLLNPNGIVFGPNAQLNLGGSFVGSTADSLHFENGEIFSAVNPQAPPLLRINVPVGLQFGANPQPIQVQGPGHQLLVDFPFIDDTLRPPGLEVRPGQTLALVGGNLALPGGNLTAIDGRIELGSVQSADRVDLRATPAGLTFNYDQVQTLGTIDLSQAASVEVSGNGVGFIQVQGHNITLTDGSTLLARTRGTADGGGLFVKASGTLDLSGFSVDPFGPAFPTSLLTDVAVFASGQGSPLTLEVETLRVAEGAFISAGTFDVGNAGDLQVTANTVELIGDGPFGSSGVFTNTFAPGAGGNLTLNAQTLHITDGAGISSDTRQGSPLGAGPAGNLSINAKTIVLSGGAPGLGASGIFATVETDRPGGNVAVNTEQLVINNGARLETTTFGSGGAGNIVINAQTVELQGRSPNGFPSGVFTDVGEGATGTGGNITLNTEQLQIIDGAEISSVNFGLGNAGNLQINARDIQLVGTPTAATGLFAAVEVDAVGNGGNLAINTNRLRVLQGAQITTGTLGAGNAGTLTLKATQIELSGGDQFGRSGLFASALLDSGAGGDLVVTVDQLTLQEGATISASNFQSQDIIPPGQGPAGSIQVQANRIQLDNQSSITASTAVGDRGNITLQAQEIFLDRSSAVTTNAIAMANGGNITLTSDIIVLSNGSRITADAVRGQGGNIQLTTEGLFPTPDSRITASSALGVDGVVTVNGLETDPSQALLVLPSQPLDVSDLVSQSCQTRHLAASSLIQTGRSGLPDTPTSWLGHPTVIADVRPLSTSTQPVSQRTAPQSSNRAPILEAQGWITNDQGQTVLIAQVPMVTAQAPHNPDLHCPSS